MRKQQGEPVPASPPQQAPDQSAFLGEYVLRTLGRPPGLHDVQVRRLWQDHYRVNVLVGPDVTSLTIAHSYFLVMDGDGNLGSSDPEITGEYASGEMAARHLS